MACDPGSVGVGFGRVTSQPRGHAGGGGREGEWKGDGSGLEGGRVVVERGEWQGGRKGRREGWKEVRNGEWKGSGREGRGKRKWGEKEA